MESFIHIIDHTAKTRGMKTRIFSVEYGKIPDFNYVRAKEDCINGYRYLVQDLGIDPKKIIVGKVNKKRKKVKIKIKIKLTYVYSW